MILYSIVPIEIVFADYSSKKPEESIEFDYLGERVEVSPLSNDQYMIKRLISTSPRAYLNPKFQPGTIINKPT